VYLIFGVPYKWREGELKAGFIPDDLLAASMIQPWTVGVYGHPNDVKQGYHYNLLYNDKVWCKDHNVDF